ncbi:MAG: cytidyltransferase-related domain protein [Ruminococcaceae bacterium]|nr:cytidyltransferase-related domain protein [Oscillospiraceae bacterium]
MEKTLHLRVAEAFAEKSFSQKLHMLRTDLFADTDWKALLAPLLPMEARVSCQQALDAFTPLLDRVAPVPEEGWLAYTYQSACSRLYTREDTVHTAVQQDGALCFLHFLQTLLDAEREVVPFDQKMDFAFCTEEELADCISADEYRRFLQCFRDEYVYELMRLGLEVTPFRTLEHIAGVHHVAMSVSRTFHSFGGLVDLGLISGAAAGHDIGKFGCKPGERVPYLHYYYTDQWFTERGLSNIGNIAANHSVWDLEIENLSSESLILVYSDFRVKQSRSENGQEITELFSLHDAFDVILSKLDNVDAAKRLRYQHVYAKLHDFEEYLTYFGVDTNLKTVLPIPPRKAPALMGDRQVVYTLRHTAVDHNIRLMHRLSHERLFADILEAARSEKDPSRIRAYVAVFSEYFTYLNANQKEQTLEFLYELLLLPDGDLRRQAAQLMGRILAGFLSGYKKELPAGIAPSPTENRPFELWAEYLQRLIHPDSRLTPRQTSMIRYQAKTVVDALLGSSSAGNRPRFALQLFSHYSAPQTVDPDGAFALLDTVLNVPMDCMVGDTRSTLVTFAIWWLQQGEEPHKAAAMRLFRHLLESLDPASDEYARIAEAVTTADFGASTPLLFLRAQLCAALGLDPSAGVLDQPETVSNVFLDNLKSATPWILKAVGVEYLLHLAKQNPGYDLDIATHFSNLIKVSENIVVRRMAGAALLEIAPDLTPDRRNEIAVELSKALETGQTEIAQYIPGYLGRFCLWLAPRELDEALSSLQEMLSSSNTGVATATLATIGAALEYYEEYGPRFGEPQDVVLCRRNRMASLLLKGLSSCHESVQQEALHILGNGLFASPVLSYDEKTSLFTLIAKKFLFLMNEQPAQELTFFYSASALSSIYRFIIEHRYKSGLFQFEDHTKAAFFPGTFDPFSLSHKGIVQAIRDLGFEVYLAVDEFSWSKKAQPSLIRRQIVNMSVADEFGVYIFPHDIPVNLASPEDLIRLRQVFGDQELYLTVGSDVVANASSYKAPPSEGSVHSMNHIVFRRASGTEHHEVETDLSALQGDVIELHLPTHLEDISSTRIRENIDLGRDITNLIDSTVQDFIFQNSLYLREPQYKRIVLAGSLEFSTMEHPTPDDWDTLRDALPRLHAYTPGECVCALWDTSRTPAEVLGCVTLRTINDRDLYDTLGDVTLANYVRSHTAGHIRLLTGLYTSRSENTTYDAGQLLLTEVLSLAAVEDCSYAVWWGELQSPQTLDLLERQGFVQAEMETPRPLMVVDMRSPAVLLQNIPTTLKEPFSSDPVVLSAVRQAHYRFQRAICAMYPGTLVLSLNAEVIYHRLVQKITELNGVPAVPTYPRTLGPKMCVPFGKILRGNAVPNTVSKTIHTDKRFAPDLRSFTISAYPGYAPLESQVRTIHSFRRPVLLVDDLLHSGARINVLEPLCRREGLEIEKVLVGLLSGRGRDLMASKGLDVDAVYFIPSLRAWFVESTMYPFIGGDTVDGSAPSVSGLMPAANLILPYAFPRFYKDRDREAVFQFSKTCLENSRDILLALENTYRERYSRNLTLSRLSEAVILPLAPDKGNTLRYTPNLSAAACIDNDLKMLLRMRDLME